MTYTGSNNGICAVILAGGEGKRFRPLTYYIPKPMIPVGSSEKPIMEFIIKWISRGGLRDFIILIGYRWRQVINYFGEGSRFNVRIRYVLDKPPYSDTGGALRRALDLGLFDDYEDVFVWYGDIIAPLNIGEFIEDHRSRKADVTLAVTSNYALPVGVARLDENLRVVELREKPTLELSATIGVLILRVDSLKRGIKSLGLGHKFDIMGDLIPGMISNGFRVEAFLYDGFWYDVGSIERYEKLDHNMLEELMGVDNIAPEYVIP